MRIQWYGHACFSLESQNSKTVVFDPFDESVGYPLPRVEASLVLVSHDHFDHNNVSIISGDPQIIDKPGEYKFDSMMIKGFSTFHDDRQGKKRGKNTVFRLEADGLVLIHCGDLGALPPEDDIKRWGEEVDILFVPVGEIFTLPIHEAKKIIDTFQPKIVVPMHYFDERLSFELHKVEPFLALFSQVQHLGKADFEVESDTLPSSLEVWVLQI